MIGNKRVRTRGRVGWKHQAHLEVVRRSPVKGVTSEGTGNYDIMEMQDAKAIRKKTKSIGRRVESKSREGGGEITLLWRCGNWIRVIKKGPEKNV